MGHRSGQSSATMRVNEETDVYPTLAVWPVGDIASGRSGLFGGGKYLELT
jgi:hypothetical protein